MLLPCNKSNNNIILTINPLQECFVINNSTVIKGCSDLQGKPLMEPNDQEGRSIYGERGSFRGIIFVPGDDRFRRKRLTPDCEPRGADLV